MSTAAPSSYLLVLRESTPEVYAAMSAEQRRDALLRWNAWCDDLAARGRLLAGSPLEPESRRVAAPAAGRVLDGPFAEAKELIGGYLLITADGLEEAAAIAAGAPNLPYGMTVEVRPLAARCHLARSLGWPTMREPVDAV